MAKITTVPARNPDDDGPVYEGTCIELDGCSITIRAASARTIYEVVYQLMEWEVECREEASRLGALRDAASHVACEAAAANWFDAADGEHLHALIDELHDMWDGRIAELKEKAEAYGDAWTHLSTLLDEQDEAEGTTLANVRQAFRRLLMEQGRHADEDDGSLRAWWGGVHHALTVFDRAAHAGWGLYHPEHVDTDQYF